MQVASALSRLSLAALALSLASAPGPARATVMVPLSIEDMSTKAAAVVRARVISTEAKWDDDHQRIYTFTDLEIVDTIYSPSALPKRVTVRTLGGEVGKVGMKVAGTEKFTVNEDVVVFLARDRISTTGGFQTVGMSQGKFHVEREAKGRWIAIPDVEGVAFARPDPTGTLKVDATTPLPDRIPLTELRDRVLGAIAAKATPAQQTPGSPVTPPAANDTPVAPR